MRKENTIKNIKFNLIFTVLLLVINFISRSVFIKFLGGDIAGFNTLILNLMSFLNVAELGVSIAITYSLYEPLSNNDFNKINDIMILFKYYYIKIATVIFILGSILGFLLRFFVKNQIPMNQAYLYYSLFLINTIIGYFFIYKQTLITADQKQYIVVTINNTIKIVKILVQILLLYIIKSYLLWIAIEIIFNIINLLISNLKIKKIYPEVNFRSEKDITTIKKEYSSILKSIRDVFCHKIASFIVYQTDGILISFFMSLKNTAIYGNYTMIINGVLNIFNSVIGSFTASIGNLISEKDDKKSFNIFKKLYMIDHFAAIIISFTLYYIIDEFINIWIGTGYIFDKSITFVLMINLYMQIARGTVENFKSSYGIFWDVWSPIVEGGINLVISYILVKNIGIIGLFIGTVISNIAIVILWKPYVLYRYGFKINIKYHVYLFSNMVSKAILAFGITSVLKNVIINFIKINTPMNMISFLIYSLLICILISTVTFSLFIINKDFRILLSDIFNSRFGVKNKFKGAFNDN